MVKRLRVWGGSGQKSQPVQDPTRYTVLALRKGLKCNQIWSTSVLQSNDIVRFSLHLQCNLIVAIQMFQLG